MASIREIGPGQIRVEIRRKGIKIPARTFETWQAAKDYATVMEAKVVTGDYKGPDKANNTTLFQALEWYELEIIPKTPKSAKNKRIHVAYWKKSRFANWKMSAIMPWDLADWRREVLDQDNAEDDAKTGPNAKWGTQTCWHYLQCLSHLFAEWAHANKLTMDSPVSRHVRPQLDDGRDRRLKPARNAKEKSEEERLLAAADASDSRWLGQAIRISLETGMRQAELADLTWDHVYLNDEFPHVDLIKTKNGRSRRVPLSKAAVSAFKALRDPAMPYTQSQVRAMNKGDALNTVLGVETSRAIIHAFYDVVSENAFPDLHWHDLRHEAISRLFENTDLRDHEIMAITGHLSAESLQRYTHLRAHKLGPRLK